MKIITRALLDALGTAVYIILVVSFMFSLQSFASKPDNILIPMAMLMLFVFSAALTSFLVFGKPVFLFIEGKKKEAVKMISYTLLFLFLLTLLAFIVLTGYYGFV